MNAPAAHMTTAFPVWTWQAGTAAAADRCRGLGLAWARAGCTDPIPVRLIGPHELVVLTAAAPDGPGPRLHLAADFLAGARAGGASSSAAAPGSGADVVADAVLGHLREQAWGVATWLTGRRGPDSPSEVTSMIPALVRHWDALAPLRYRLTGPEATGFTTVVAEGLAGLLAMWLDRPGADLRADVLTSAEALAGAGPAVREERTIRRLVELASTNPRLRHRDRLTDSGFLVSELAAVDPLERDALAAGDTAAALTFLIGTDRYL